MKLKLSLKRLEFYITFFRLRLASLCYALRKRGNRNSRRALPLSRSSAYFQQNPDSPFYILKPNLAPQFNESSCSVASVAAVLNATSDLSRQTDGKTSISQEEILERVDVVHWKERVSRKGHKNRRGLTIDMLGQAVEAALRTYNIPCERIDVVSLNPNMTGIEKRKEELRQRLKSLEKTDTFFIIAHFNQGIFTGGLHIPHISPVGAYDNEKNRVLILDVDPEQPEPYWVTFETFFEGLTWDYHSILKKYGYNGGGYVWIRLKPRAPRSH